MKKTNRIVSLLLALTTIIGLAVFTANAEIPTETITVDYCDEITTAPVITTDIKYIATVPGSDCWRRDAVVRFQTNDVDGYYTLTVKNENDPLDDTEIRVQLMNSDTDGLMLFSLTNNTEASDCMRLNANTEYYISFINLWKADVTGKVSFTLDCAPDPEPNEKKGKILVPSNEFYEGNLANADDVDWVCLGDYDTKQYRLLLESREEGQELRAVVYTYSAYKDEVSLIYGETRDAVTIPASGKNERYYVKVTGIDGSCGDYALRLEELSAVTPENDRTLSSVKFMPVFTNSKYDEGYSLAEPVIFGRECVSVIGENTYQTRAECVKISTEDLSGEFEITLKNVSVPTDEGEFCVEVHQNSRSSAEPILTTSLAMGEEQTYTLEFAKNKFYYINFYSLAEENDLGGMVSFKVSQVLAPEETTEPKTEATETTAAVEVTEVTYATEATTETLPFEETTSIQEITTAPELTLMLGDTDKSGKINIKDATLIQKALAKLTELDNLGEKLADVTEDGKVNIKDATAIQKFLAKIEIPYRIGEYVA